MFGREAEQSPLTEWHLRRQHGRSTPARPGPIGRNTGDNFDVFAGEQIAVYRLLNGITQQAVADNLRVAQSWLTTYESGRASVAVPEKQALQILDAVDYLVGRRERVIAEGRARRDGTAPPQAYKERAGWRAVQKAAK